VDEATRLMITALQDEMRNGFASMRESNDAAHAETREVLRAENEAAHAETRAVLRAESAAAHAETRRQSHVLAEDLSTRIDAVAEAVRLLDAKVDRNVERLDARMDHGFAEMVALINWSHSNLDLRLSALE
jgi:hypothetical protein